MGVSIVQWFSPQELHRQLQNLALCQLLLPVSPASHQAAKKDRFTVSRRTESRTVHVIKPFCFYTHNPMFQTKTHAKQCNTFCAWTTVLGKPSRMKPFWHDGFFIASSIMPTTKSSETSSPWKMTAQCHINNFYCNTSETTKPQVRLYTINISPYP